MKILCSILFILCYNYSFGQYLISTASLSEELGGNHYSFSIGETIIGTSASNRLTSGFLQPISPIITSIGDESISVIKLFPNPTIGHLTVEGEFDLVRVYDLLGNLKQESNQSHLNMEGYASGIYKIYLLKGNQIISTQNIIKL